MIQRASSLLRYVILKIALLGGIGLLLCALMVSIGAGGRKFFHTPFPGSFEILEITTAVVGFCFFPYCQLKGENIALQLIKLPPLLQKLGTYIGHILQGSIGAVGAYCLGTAVLDFYPSQEATMQLGIPLWIVLAICCGLFFLLFLASLLPLQEDA